MQISLMKLPSSAHTLNRWPVAIGRFEFSCLEKPILTNVTASEQSDRGPVRDLRTALEQPHD